MAETKHTSSAISSDHESSPEGVTPAVGNPAGAPIKGSENMNMLSPICTPADTKEATNSAAALWRIVVSEYETAKTAMKAAGAAYSKAEELFFEETETLGITAGGAPLSREQARENALLSIIARDHLGKRELTPEERRAMNAEADQRVERYFEDAGRHSALKEKYSVDELEEAADAAGEACSEAEQKVIDTPAPDGAAALFKLALVADWYAGPDGDAHGFAQLRDDLRRLLPKSAPDRSAFEQALADYEAKRAVSDAMPLGTDGEDDALEEKCAAEDLLIEQVPAPDIEAVALKLKLAIERGGTDGIFPSYADAIAADLDRLAGLSSANLQRSA